MSLPQPKLPADGDARVHAQVVAVRTGNATFVPCPKAHARGMCFRWNAQPDQCTADWNGNRCPA